MKMKKQSELKKQNTILLLLAGLALSLHLVAAQEITEALRSANSMFKVVNINANPSVNNLIAITPALKQQASSLEPLVVQPKNTASGFEIKIEDKDLMFAGGGFEGDGQKTVTAKESLLILIAGTIVYALVKRKRMP
jgi:hypothetical protein